MWDKFKHPQFWVMLAWVVLLIAAKNTAIEIPDAILAAMTAAVVAWIGGEMYVDREKVSTTSFERDAAANRAAYRAEQQGTAPKK